MNLRIKNISLGELENYLGSKEYKEPSFVPISKIRALSHLNNPGSSKADYCLFLAYDDSKFIGYLGALSDLMFFEKKQEKVFWLSCMWVLPDYRRHGVALELLKHAYKVFNGKVLITNFIPQSRKAFDKTGQYTDLIQLKGIRGYLRSDLANILTRKNTQWLYGKPLLKVFDFSVNTLVNLRVRLKLHRFQAMCSYEEIKTFDPALQEFIHKRTKTALFRRDVDQFRWMRDYPWVKNVKHFSEESGRYHFSQESKDFRQWFIRVEDEGKIAGFLMLSKNKGELKTPYLLFEKEYVEDISGFIIRLCIKEGVKTYIGYNPQINSSIIKSGVLLVNKKSIYGFLIGKDLFKELDVPINLFEGDGDGAFV